MARTLAELVGITKCFRSNWTFRPTRAIDALSLSILDGEVFGLNGHNGAGKTTTLKLLVGLLRPTSGTLLWEDTPLEWHHPRTGIGFSPEQPYFYEYLTVRETLNFYAQLYGMDAAAQRTRVSELAEQFRIAHKLNARIRTLSKGTLQRVAVAQAIMHRPRLVILDEPMSGLDPVGRKEIRDLIASLKDCGTTVLFSSHILSDAEALCDRVAILASGRLQEIIDLNKTIDAPQRYVLTVVGASPQLCNRLENVAAEPLVGGPARLVVKLGNSSAIHAALSEIQGTTARIEALVSERPSLEERFLRHAANGVHGD